MDFNLKIFCATILTVTTLIVTSHFGIAQQDPGGTPYLFNPMLSNPAFAGYYESAEFVFSGSMQGASIPGAQKNAMVSLNTPLPNRRVGLGGSVIHEQFGVTSITGLYGAYAYKLISKNRNSYTDWEFYPSVLSLGLLAGVTIYEEDLLELEAEDDPNYATNLKETVPSFGFGIYYSRNKFSIGLSAPQLIKTRTEDDNLNINRHYYLSSGVRFRIAPNWILNPKTLIKYVGGAPLQVDLLATTSYNNKFDFSLGYRSHSSLIVATAMTITKHLKTSIYWDYHTSTRRKALSDTYGLQLSYMIGDGYRSGK